MEYEIRKKKKEALTKNPSRPSSETPTITKN